MEFGCLLPSKRALASFYAVHINALSIYNEIVDRKQQHTSGINMIP